jgi:coniferyl-aldehyde dehydrogenase
MTTAATRATTSTTPVSAASKPRAMDRRLQAALARLQAAHHAHPMPSLAERQQALRQLLRFVQDHQEAICEAISADYGHRSRHETLLMEIMPVITDIKATLKHLREWMKPQERAVDRRLFGLGRNTVTPQPLGVVGVIVPWNFPINLSLLPLVAILAAGNRAMVKFSEHSRRLSRLVREQLPAYLPADQVAVFDETGGVGEAFSRLPFDHLLFTGSGTTGRAVMRAAAANLTPVTLELGGKSPAVVCDDYPLRTAAERILHVKCLNAGQVCTTVDHVYLPRAEVARFVALAQDIVPRRYASIASPDYTAIISAAAFDRLVAGMDEARARGARLVPLHTGPALDRRRRKIGLHLLLDAPDDIALMAQEIFGPILPVIGYDTLDEVIAHINRGSRPLALYPFSHRRAHVQKLIERVMSGGVTVNDALMHVGQHDLPFGGVGESGMGHYHGREGFENFSKLRPVFHQARVSATRLLAPPYGQLAERAVRFLLR